jgi:hypothetical protein
VAASLAAYACRATFGQAMITAIAGTWGVLLIYAVIEVIRARGVAAAATAHQ